MKNYSITYAINKEAVKEPLAIEAETYTKAYLEGMRQLPTEAEITGVYETSHCITLNELREKEKELIAEYNENIKKGWGCFAENSIKNLEAVRYIIRLIENK